MKPSHQNSVMLLAIGTAPAAGVMQTAQRKGWAVQMQESAADAYRAIVRGRPDVAVVQISTRPAEELALFRRIRANLLAVSLVAVALVHDEETERAARIAGVDGYLSGAAATLLLERTVADMLARYEHDASGGSGGRDRMHKPHRLLRRHMAQPHRDAKIARAATLAQRHADGPHQPDPSARTAHGFVLAHKWKPLRHRATWRGCRSSSIANDGRRFRGDSR